MVKLMLCSEYKPSFWEDKQFVIEEKLDGMRAYAIKTPVGTTLYSRDNNVLHGFEYITDELNKLSGDAFIIDGEIVPYGYEKMSHMECFESVSHINSHDNPGYVFVAFDLIRMFKNKLGSYNERYGVLRILIENCVNIIPSRWLYKGEDLRAVQNLLTWASNKKKEGIVIKDCKSDYECRRSNSWQKLKVRSTIDVKIKDVISGNGKYENTCGAILCEAKHPSGISVSFTCGTGFSDEMRKYFWETKKKLIGMHAEIYHGGFTRNAVRHPVFKTLK